MTPTTEKARSSKEGRKPDPVAQYHDAIWMRRDAIREYGDIIASLGVSLAEAAYRGSDATAEITLKQIIEATRTACATFRELKGNAQ